MAPPAYIVHQVHGRLRLRVPEMRGDPDYFEEVADVLAERTDDIRVRTNHVTGSVLLLHPLTSYEELETALLDLDLFELSFDPEPDVNALTPLVSGIDAINRSLSDSTSGRVDLRTVVVIVVLALVLRQALRGEVVGPAFTMLWSTLDLAMRLHRTVTDQ